MLDKKKICNTQLTSSIINNIIKSFVVVFVSDPWHQGWVVSLRYIFVSDLQSLSPSQNPGLNLFKHITLDVKLIKV